MLAVGILLEPSCISRSHAATKLEIDFIEAKLNGTNMFELDVDRVTDILGRPFKVLAPSIKKEIGLPGTTGKTVKSGTRLYYRDMGIICHFAHKEEDVNERLIYLEIFLASTSIESAGLVMSVFPGTLNKGLSGNWKPKRVLDEFSEFSPIDVFNEEKEVAARNVSLNGDVLRRLQSRITFDRPTHRTFIFNEANTKFVESLSIGKKRP